MTNLLSLFRRHPDIDALSAHLDGRLDSSAAAGLESHVSACEACAARLLGLRAAQSALRTVESVDAPRSFRLRQADVEAGVRAAPRRGGTSLALRLMPATSAAAVVLLVVLVGADLLSQGGGSSSSNTTRALTGQSAEKSAGDAAAAPAPRSADAPAGAPAPTSTESAGDGDLAWRIATPPPAAAGQAIAPEPSAPGTFPAAAPSTTEPKAAEAARPTPPTGALTYRDAQAPPTDTGDGWSGLRIAEVIAGAIAAGAGAMAVARRVVTREVR